MLMFEWACQGNVIAPAVHLGFSPTSSNLIPYPDPLLSSLLALGTSEPCKTEQHCADGWEREGPGLGCYRCGDPGESRLKDHSDAGGSLKCHSLNSDNRPCPLSSLIGKIPLNPPTSSYA